MCGEQQAPSRKAWSRHGKDPGPKHPEAPQGTGPPGEPPQGQPRPPPRKGRGEPEGGTSDSHSVGAPGCRGGKPAGSTGSRPHQVADRALGPETQRPPTPQSGPSKASRPGPANRPPRVGRRSPEHPAPAREITNAPAASSTGRAWWWGGGSTKMMSEAESKARPGHIDVDDKHTYTQAYVPTLMHANEYSHLRPTCRHTKMDTVPTLTLPICTLYS